MILIIGFCLCTYGCPATPPVDPALPAKEPSRSLDTPPEEPIDLPKPEAAVPPNPASVPSQPIAQTEPPPSTPQQPPEEKPQPPAPPASTASSTEGQSANLKKAKQLFNSAKSKRRAGQFSAAFLEAKEAWNLVQESQNPGEQQLADEIRTELNSLAGKLTPSKQNPPSKFKTLILK